MKITKAVITAAGVGTRFLPATKNVPKELIPIINKPTIHYVVDQLIDIGITDIIIVTRHGNNAVEDYFDANLALENYLAEKQKNDLLQEIKNIYTKANFVFVRQKPDLPYGNAGPLYSARKLLQDEPFLYAFGDVLILGEQAGFAELIAKYSETDADVILNCSEFAPEQIIGKRDGITLQENSPDQVQQIIEKPTAEQLTSNYASISPYLFTPAIFEHMIPEKNPQLNEFIIQDAIAKMLDAGKDIRISMTSGEYVTTGDPLNYLKATFKIALQRPDLRDKFLDFLQQELNSLSK